MSEKNEQLEFELNIREVIKGFPELRWTGKRPYRGTQFFPAQLKETYGSPENGWINKLFWGDNLQVMSHLLKEFRGKIDLIYIDPPFDSKADYKKKIEIKNIGKVDSDTSSFEEKQYGDIWSNDEYLQFMYERIQLMRELLSDEGCILLHCDYRRVAHLRMILDEVFGSSIDTNFRNEIIWSYRTGGASKGVALARKHDDILLYSKTSKFKVKVMKERQYLEKSFMDSKIDNEGRYYVDTILRDTIEGVVNIVEDEEKHIIKQYNTRAVLNLSSERVDYPTQKPEGLLMLLIEACSKPGDLIFDCFMGSGTAQAAAMKTGRRFIGADINLGAIQTTTKRLIKLGNEIKGKLIDDFDKYTSFEVYNVNNYDFFRNPVEAKDLLIQALEIQPFDKGGIWDGELDGRMVKIMPVNRIATKADLEELKTRLPYSTYEKRKEENPTSPVEKITIVCMGHEPDLKASLERDLDKYKVDIEVVDILRDKTELQFKRDAEADVVKEGNKLIIRSFYPMNLMQKLSLQKEKVDEWRQLVESVMIDWNYDGAIMSPSVIDIPEKNNYVEGIYEIPEDSGTIKVKITDLLSESLEVEV